MNNVTSEETSEKHYNNIMCSSNSFKCRFCCYRRQHLECQQWWKRE